MQTGFQVAKHKPGVIGQVLEIVEQVHKKVFLTQCLWISRNHTEQETVQDLEAETGCQDQSGMVVTMALSMKGTPARAAT